MSLHRWGISHLVVAAALAASPPASSQENQKSFQNDQELGRTFHVTADALPQPYDTSSVRNPAVVVPRDGAKPKVEDGFTVALFADNLDHPRQMLVLENGDVLLAEQKSGKVTFLRDTDGDSKADIVSLFAGDFKGPYGLAQLPSGENKGDILVADTEAIWRVPFKLGGIRPDMSALSRAEPASKTPKDARKPIEPADHLPVTDEGVFGAAEGHSTRSLAIDPLDGSMYVGVGSMGNIAVEPKVKATIQKFDASGDVQSTFASGTRNPIGLSIHPKTGKLWAVVQERDGLGNRLVPDYLTEVSQGDFFGWPYSYTGTNPQPGFAKRAPDKVKQASRPSVLFEAHSAPMDFAWIPDSWPEDMRGSAVVALKGSWNREDPTGYKVVIAHFEGGKPTGEYTNLVTGFWVRGKNRAEVWGRPADVAFLPDGGLLIADDSGGTIWKIKPQKDD